MRRPLPFGKYLLLERVNVGGMAEVFIAKAFGVEGFERILAIKRILPTMAEDAEFISMFIDEARISVQLNHANIVHIHELGKYAETYFIAMEYVSGKDLRGLLEYYQREKMIMPAAQAVYIASRMCDGLDHAHRKKDARGGDLHIVHRDVSPQNVLLSFDGEVKLIDFGIAKAAGRLQKTQAGILKGKFGYMSPEQVRGLELDHRSDIFAVGVVLYEMLTGQRLFTGESDFSVLERVRDAVVPPPREFNADIPEGLERVLLRALSGERDERYQWASDLQEDLMRFLLAGDAIYGAKHLSGFLRSAFADDLLLEAERMERFATIDRPEELDVSRVVTAHGPRPDLAESPGARAAAPEPSAPETDDLGDFPALDASDRTMISEPPSRDGGLGGAAAIPVAATVIKNPPETHSRPEVPRVRTPVRDQVVIGSGAKYDGETFIGQVPSQATAGLGDAGGEGGGDATYVGPLPQSPTPLPASARAAAVASDQTHVGPVPTLDASGLENDDESTGAGRAAALANETYVGPIPTMDASGLADDDASSGPADRAAALASETYVGPVPTLDASGLEDDDESTGGAARAASLANETYVGPAPSLDSSRAGHRHGGRDDASGAMSEDAQGGWAAPTAEPSTAANEVYGGAIPSDDDDEGQETRMLEAAAFADQMGFEDPSRAQGPADEGVDVEDRTDPAIRLSAQPFDEREADGSPGGDPHWDDDAPEDGHGEDEDWDDDEPRTRLRPEDGPDDPDEPSTRLLGSSADDVPDTRHQDFSQQFQTPSRAGARSTGRVSAAAGLPGGLKDRIRQNPRPWLAGGVAGLLLLIVGGVLLIGNSATPSLRVDVDPASARLTVNGQPAIPGGIVASGPGVYLVRAEASGHLPDEREVELRDDSGAVRLPLILGKAPTLEVEPAPAPEPVVEAPIEPAAPANEPARARFLGEVAGAEVRLDGELVGRLPDFETQGLVDGRTYTYSVTHEGYLPATGEFSALEGRVMEVEVELERIPVAPRPPAATPSVSPASAPAPVRPAAAAPAVARQPASRPAPRQMGKLAASSRPSGATIYVDGKKVDRVVTPVGLSSPLALPVGEHTIVFKLGDRASAPQKITVAPEGITKLANVPIP